MPLIKLIVSLLKINRFSLEIDSEAIYQLAKNMAGSGGPSKVDADMWKHILCSKHMEKNLCNCVNPLLILQRDCVEKT
jgi:hypothetical protein